MLSRFRKPLPNDERLSRIIQLQSRDRLRERSATSRGKNNLRPMADGGRLPHGQDFVPPQAFPTGRAGILRPGSAAIRKRISHRIVNGMRCSTGTAINSGKGLHKNYR